MIVSTSLSLLGRMSNTVTCECTQSLCRLRASNPTNLQNNTDWNYSSSAKAVMLCSSASDADLIIARAQQVTHEVLPQEPSAANDQAVCPPAPGADHGCCLLLQASLSYQVICSGSLMLTFPLALRTHSLPTLAVLCCSPPLLLLLDHVVQLVSRRRLWALWRVHDVVPLHAGTHDAVTAMLGSQ